MFEFLMKLPSNNDDENSDEDDMLKSKNLGKDEREAQDFLKRISTFSQKRDIDLKKLMQRKDDESCGQIH